MITSTRKLREKSDKLYSDDVIDDDDIEGKRLYDLNEKLNSEDYTAEFVLEMSGSEVTIEHLQRTGHRFPVVIHDKTGLGLRIPSENFRVSDVKRCVGSRRMLDVMDVETQKGLEMSLKDWEAYYENPERERLLNVISLEFSHTRLDQYVDAPNVVRQIDFINSVWPPYLKECHTESTNVLEKMMYPKVQKYCLMSVANCFTDFHIDFGGTSVWYHILHGKKIFWLIQPTDDNLERYVEWVLSGNQGEYFLADKMSECQKVVLNQGDTFLIPSGWIHAVYTPVDSLVFGGNFLHSYNLTQQIKVTNIEDRTRVPTKFRFPFFTEMMWYILAQYVRCIMGNNHFVLPSDDDEKVEKPPPMKDSPPKSDVILTPFELEGLEVVMLWLENLPETKKSIPKDLTDIHLLLHRVKELLHAHQGDDPSLSVTGQLPISWPEMDKKPKKVRQLSLGGSGRNSSTINKTKVKIVNVNRRRRTRCKKCEACLRDDCGECNFCNDMKKYGGPGRMKQSCKSRQCMAPILPTTATCQICGRDTNIEETDDGNFDNQLMECGICWDITHPACLRGKYENLSSEGILNEDLPNSWQCSRCCHDGKEGQLKPRVPKGGGPSAVCPSATYETDATVIDSIGTMKAEIVAEDNIDLDESGLGEYNDVLTNGEDVTIETSHNDSVNFSDLDILLKNVTEKENKPERKPPIDDFDKSDVVSESNSDIHKGNNYVSSHISAQKWEFNRDARSHKDRIVEVKINSLDEKPADSLISTSNTPTKYVGKRVTSHGKRKSLENSTDDSPTTDDTSRDVPAVLVRVPDITPILERFGATPSKMPVLERFDSPSESKDNSTPTTIRSSEPVTKVCQSTSDKNQSKTSTTEPIQGDSIQSAKRPRREVVMPKRYLD